MPIRKPHDVAAVLVSSAEKSLSTSLRHSKYAWIRTGDEVRQARDTKDRGFQSRVVGGVCDGWMSLPPRLPAAAQGLMPIPFCLKSRLIVNQSGGVLEHANLCLDPHFGCPFIPGTAIKGIARHAGWLRWWECDEAEGKLQLARMMADAFGFPTGDRRPKKDPEDRVYLDDFLAAADEREGIETKAQSGGVVFYPAYPARLPKLELDVATCHHPGYYQGNQKKATDDENPQPHFFPTVAAGAEFLFCIAPSRRLRTVDETRRAEILRFAADSLRAGVQDHGIGSKTAAGYGWFAPPVDGAAAFALGQASTKADVAPPTSDYTEVTFKNRVTHCVSSKGEWGKLREEMVKLQKPENKEWLERFLRDTAGKDDKELRKQPWYPTAGPTPSN